MKRNTLRGVLRYRLARLRVRYYFILKPNIKWRIHYRLKYLLGVNRFIEIGGTACRAVILKVSPNKTDYVLLVRTRHSKGMYNTGLTEVYKPIEEVFNSSYALSLYLIHKNYQEAASTYDK